MKIDVFRQNNHNLFALKIEGVAPRFFLPLKLHQNLKTANFSIQL